MVYWNEGQEVRAIGTLRNWTKDGKYVSINFGHPGGETSTLPTTAVEVVPAPAGETRLMERVPLTFLWEPDVKHLLRYATIHRHGYGKRVGRVLLSLWDSEQFLCNLNDLLCLETEEFNEVIRLLIYLRKNNTDLKHLVSEDEVAPLLKLRSSLYDRNSPEG
jgi:hypothetical protein